MTISREDAREFSFWQIIHLAPVSLPRCFHSIPNRNAEKKNEKEKREQSYRDCRFFTTTTHIKMFIYHAIKPCLIVVSIAITSLLGTLLRPSFHSRYKCLTLALAEILVGVVKIYTDTFVLIVLISYFTAGYRSLDTLLVCTETRTTPAHFTEQLMTLVALVQCRFLCSFTRISCASANYRKRNETKRTKHAFVYVNYCSFPPLQTYECPITMDDEMDGAFVGKFFTTFR